MRKMNKTLIKLLVNSAILSNFVFLVTACSSMPHIRSANPSEPSSFELVPVALTDSKDLKTQALFVGGLSALYFEKEDQTGIYFWTLSDRGPNEEPIKANNKVLRPFVLPEFVPSLYRIKANKLNAKLEILETLPIKFGPTQLASGLPPCSLKDLTDLETPIKSMPHPVEKADFLSCSDFGIDPEAISRDEDGYFWIGEEYFPAILKLALNGNIIDRIVPQNSGKVAYQSKIQTKIQTFEILPKEYLKRKANRGFEGLALGAKNIFAMVQSPLKVDSKTNNINGVPTNFSRIVELDPKTNKVINEFYYPFEPGVDKIGDMTYIRDRKFAIIEQETDSERTAFHRIYEVDLNSPRTLVHKKLLLDLEAWYLDHKNETYIDHVPAKIEGISFIDRHRIAVINDNDFGVNTQNPEKRTVLQVITLPH